MLKLVIVVVLATAAFGSFRPVVLDQTEIEHNPFGSKVFGGIDANDGEFPYIVSYNYQGGAHSCGGSILTPDWILTAAHCCFTESIMEIYSGSIYLSKGGQIYSIKQRIIHEDYQADSHWKNDICVINLSSPIQYNNNAQPVKLPPRDLVINSSDSLTICGWGRTDNNDAPDRLQVLNNDKALTNQECIKKTNVDIHPGQICTNAGVGFAMCSGDSGGPLSLNGVQVGLTSWGWNCGIGMPDVFTRVSYYIDWIEQVLGSSAKELQFATSEDLL